MNTKHSTFLAKGTYGCVFYPSINACTGKMDTDIDSDHYITKIQKYAPNQNDEIEIGELLQTLPLCDHYFAPVVKSCKIQTAKMDYKLVKTCRTMQNELGEFEEKTSYVSNKIRYVGKQNITAYMKSLTNAPILLYRKLINTHLHILDALQLLASENIVQFDIKPQNIMYDEIQDIPIIIDFGISRIITPLLTPHFSAIKSETTLRRIFISDESYDYWCIDIFILSNIGTRFLLKPHSEVSENHIKILLRGFLTPIFLASLTGEEVSQFKHNIMNYFEPFIANRQTWSDVFKTLIQNYATWDNYSTAMAYMYTYLKSKPANTYLKEPTEIQEYLAILKNIIIAMPNERPLPETTQKAIRDIFATTISTAVRTPELGTSVDLRRISGSDLSNDNEGIVRTPELGTRVGVRGLSGDNLLSQDKDEEDNKRL